MIQEALDFENIFEESIAALLRSAGLTVFTSGMVPDFQKDRPRVEVLYKHGPAHSPLQTANPMALPDDLKGDKIVVAWDSSLHTNIVTSANATGKQQQSDIRGILRLVYLNLPSQLNGNLLTGHKLNLVREGGSSRGLHPNDSNSEVLQMVHDLQVYLHESVWSEYTRITDYGTNRSGFTRILSTGTATTTLFKNITDLNVGSVVNGNDVLEVVHAGENVQVTIDTLSAAIGGGGGGTQISSGLSDPIAPPTDPTKVALRFNENTGYGWRWVVKDQAWT